MKVRAWGGEESPIAGSPNQVAENTAEEVCSILDAIGFLDRCVKTF